MCGGNIRGGQVIGSTDRIGAAPHDYPIKPPRVIASIYKGMGIDLETKFLNLAGRPTNINNYGNPIESLI